MTIRNVAQTAYAASAPTREPAAQAQAAADPKDQAILSGGRVKSAKADKAEAGKPEYAPGQVLLRFKPGQDANTLSQDLGLSVIRKFEFPQNGVESAGGDLYQFKLPAGETVEDAMARLSGQPGVAYVEPNYKIQLDTQAGTATERTPNDLDSKLWGLKNDGQDGGTA